MSGFRNPKRFPAETLQGDKYAIPVTEALVAAFDPAAVLKISLPPWQVLTTSNMC
jgi:hypothetical protein